MLKAIVFDFDGVIADSEPLHYRAFLKVAQEFGVTFTYDQYLRDFIGFDDRDAFRVMLGAKPGAIASPTIEEKVGRLTLLKAKAFELAVEEGIDTIPGTVDLIKQAGAQMPIAIASGATRADIDLILAKLGLAHLFSTIVSADDVERSKPDPASYRMAVELLTRKHPKADLAPEFCLAIEDTHAGLTSAKTAGLMTLGVATTGPAESLSVAHRVIAGPHETNLDQLRAWFG
jgi:beta-phosphoglucomutase